MTFHTRHAPKAAAGLALCLGLIFATISLQASWLPVPILALVLLLRIWLESGSIEAGPEGLLIHKTGRIPFVLPWKEIRGIRMKTEFPWIQNWLTGTARIEIYVRRSMQLRAQRIRMGDLRRGDIQALMEK